MSGFREAIGTENAVAMINDCLDMQVLVCIDATNDVNFCSVFSHLIILSCGMRIICLKGAGTGQSWDRMVMPFLGHSSTFEARPHRRAFPDDRQVRGKTHIGLIGMRGRSYREAMRTSPESGQSVFESNHPRTGINHMTIRMNNWPFICVGHSFDGGIEHRIDQFRIWFCSNRPTDDQTIEAVYDG